MVNHSPIVQTFRIKPPPLFSFLPTGDPADGGRAHPAGQSGLPEASGYGIHPERGHPPGEHGADAAASHRSCSAHAADHTHSGKVVCFKDRFRRSRIYVGTSLPHLEHCVYANVKCVNIYCPGACSPIFSLDGTSFARSRHRFPRCFSLCLFARYVCFSSCLQKGKSLLARFQLRTAVDAHSSYDGTGA